MLYFLLLLVISSQCGKLSSETDTLALFSITKCPEEVQFHCQNARINEKRFQLAHSVANPPYQLCTIDVQNSRRLIANLSLEIIEHDKVNYFGRCLNKTLNVTLDYRKNTLVFTYVLPFELTRFISFLFSVKHVQATLVSVTTERMFPSQLIDNDRFVYSYEASFESEIHLGPVADLIRKYQMSYAAVINLKERPTDL